MLEYFDLTWKTARTSKGARSPANWNKWRCVHASPVCPLRRISLFTLIFSPICGVLPASAWLVLKAEQPHAFWPSFVLIYPLPSFGPLLITDLYENPPGSSCQELQLQVQSLGLQIARLCQAVRGSQDDDDDPIAAVNITRRVWILPGHWPVPVKMQRCWCDLNQLNWLLNGQRSHSFGPLAWMHSRYPTSLDESTKFQDLQVTQGAVPRGW